MAKFVLISDTHGQHEKLKLPEGDFLIHAGDWTSRGLLSETVSFLEWFNRRPHRNKLFIAGNHDFYAEEYIRHFHQLIDLYAPSCHYLHDEQIEIEGFKIHGSPVSPWFNDWAFNRLGEDIKRDWDKIPDDVDILITHTPPLDYGDKLGSRGSLPYANIGCPYLLDRVAHLRRLKLHVFGHIHEGHGVYGSGSDPIFVNASVLDENYRLKNKPIVLELD